MEILIRLAGVQLGPYSETQVREHLTDGLLSLTDSAKSVDMEEWVTLAEVLAKALPPPAAAPTVALPDAEKFKLESEVIAPPEVPKRAPNTPPGVRHLPTRPQEPSNEPLSIEAKKTMLIGPKAPASGLTPGSSVGSSTATTSPLMPSSQTNLKKTSRDSVVKSLAQQTSPLPTKSIKADATAPLEKPKFPPAEQPNPKKEAADALARSLTAKTVPMRSSSAPPVPPTSASTSPLPTRPALKPSPPPPSVVDDLTKKLGQMVMPDPVQTSPSTLGLETGKKKTGPVKAKYEKAESPPPADEPVEKSVPKRPVKILPGLIVACGILAALMLYYIWSPYHAASLLRAALASGDASDLDAAIDFPAARASLKDQVKNQLAQSGVANPSVESVLNTSIDLYVTPSGISELITKSDQISKVDQDQRISPDVASKVLLALNNAPAKGQGLASLSDFVIDRDTTLWHLHFRGIGWKLDRIDLRPDWLASAASGATPPLLSPVVNTYLERGDAKAKKSDWAGAIAEYTQVLAVDPRSSAAYNARGNARESKGDFDGAIKDYTQALTIDPQMAVAYEGRGNAKAAKNDDDGAIADFTQAIRIDPTLAASYDSRGNAKTAKGDDLDGAITDFTQAITLDPQMASAYSDRGFARQANGNLDGAIADYTQALALKPKTAVAYYNRGLARQSQGNLDAAIVDFDRALAFDPKIADAYYNRGNAKSATHDLDGAIIDYTKALELNPKKALAYSNRGAALQAKGDLNGALADYTAALGIDAKISGAYFSRGIIEAQKDDLDDAIADSTQSLYLDPKNAAAYYTRGFAKLAKGNLDGARDDLKQFCDLSPKDHNADRARLYLWLISKAQNGKADVDQELSDALENSWNSTPDDQVTKTATFFLGRTGEADYLAAAASSDAKTDQAQHCGAWYFSGMKRLLTGDKKGAIEAFRQAVATGQKDSNEYLLAQSELQALETPPPAAAIAPTVRVPPVPVAPPATTP